MTIWGERATYCHTQGLYLIIYCPNQGTWGVKEGAIYTYARKVGRK